MIIVLFGQPCSGKTTLAKKLEYELSLGVNHTKIINIDGDTLRKIFKNNGYSKKDRLQNLKLASNIATFLNNAGYIVIMSMVFPYVESRDYLNELNENVVWVHLHYEGIRGREDFHVYDFDEPTLDELKNPNFISINTSKFGEYWCVQNIRSLAKL